MCCPAEWQGSLPGTQRALPGNWEHVHRHAHLQTEHFRLALSGKLSKGEQSVKHQKGKTGHKGRKQTAENDSEGIDMTSHVQRKSYPQRR